MHPRSNWQIRCGVRSNHRHAFDGIHAEFIEQSSNVARDLVLALEFTPAVLLVPYLVKMLRHQLSVYYFRASG